MFLDIFISTYYNDTVIYIGGNYYGIRYFRFLCKLWFMCRRMSSRSYQPGIIFVLNSKEAVGFATQLLFLCEKLAKRVSRSYALICEAMLHLVSIPVSYETASSLSFPLPSGSDESARPVSYSVLPPLHPVPASDNSFLLIHNPAPVR